MHIFDNEYDFSNEYLKGADTLVSGFSYEFEGDPQNIGTASHPKWSSFFNSYEYNANSYSSGMLYVSKQPAAGYMAVPDIVAEGPGYYGSPITLTEMPTQQDTTNYIPWVSVTNRPRIYAFIDIHYTGEVKKYELWYWDFVDFTEGTWLNGGDYQTDHIYVWRMTASPDMGGYFVGTLTENPEPGDAVFTLYYDEHSNYCDVNQSTITVYKSKKYRVDYNFKTIL